MARSKKRPAPTAASERSSKKRKSAEASMAKMKQIQDDEKAFSEDEKVEVEPLVTTTTTTTANVAAAEESEDEDVEGMEDHDVVTKGNANAVAAGFRLWNTKSKLVSKGKFSEVSKYDDAKGQFSHFLKINHDEAFKLVPLTVTTGPHKGSHVFMLQPQTGFFRFMDFPAEIRNLVYSFLFEADDGIKVVTAKRVNEPRRPVPSREGNGSQRYWQRQRKPNPDAEDKSLPTNIKLLLTNKQILSEAAPILYGNNHFRFIDLADLKIFLERIGSMRKYLCHIHIDQNSYWYSKGRVTLSLLASATDLRSLHIDHGDICSNDNVNRWGARYYTSPNKLAYLLSHPLRTVRTANESKGSPRDVLSILKIDYTKCAKCRESPHEFSEECIGLTGSAYSYEDCKVKCKDGVEHCKKIEEKFRARMVEFFGFKDLATEKEAAKPDGIESVARFRVVKETEEEVDDDESDSESEYYYSD